MLGSCLASSLSIDQTSPGSPHCTIQSDKFSPKSLVNPCAVVQSSRAEHYSSSSLQSDSLHHRSVPAQHLGRYTAELEAATSSQIAAQDGTGPNLSDKSLSKSFEVLCVYLAGTKKKYLYIARGVHSGWGTGPAGGGGRRSSTAVRRRRTVSSSLCSRAETFSALLALPVCARQRNWTA